MPAALRPAVTIYGSYADLTGLTTRRELSSGHPAAYVPIRKMKWEAGSTAFGCATIGGFVYVGVLNASTNSLSFSYIDSTLHAFRPTKRTWTVITLETDLGFSGVVSANGFGTGDYPALVSTAGKVIALSVWDYGDWVIGTYGRYPAWAVLDHNTVDYALSKTIDQLRADAADGNGALSFPDQTNVHAETYAGNRGMANADVLPNGWVCAVDYFAVPGKFSGRLKVFDTDGVQQGFYQWPDMQTEDGVALQAAPKFISADPSSVTPTDYRMIVNFDMFVRSTSTAQPFMVQEMAFDSTTGAITPVSAPTSSSTQNETANFSDYTGNASARPSYSADGTCWVPASIRGTFNQRPMAVWLKTGTERRWTAENPPTAGWENRLGEVRMIPDFELGALAQTNQLHSGEYIERFSGGHVVVGFLGGLFPFVPDKPLVLRTVLHANPDFTSNVTGWASFGASGGIAWEATDSGRLKFTGNGSAANGVFQSSVVGSFNPLPRRSAGQSFWAKVRFKPNTTAREVQIDIAFYDAEDNHISSISGPTRFEVGGTYVTTTVGAEVPATATQYVVFCRIIGGGVNGEIHYTDSSYEGIAPVTHRDAADLDLSLLPKGTFDIRWPAGSSSRTAIDTARIGWLPITCLENGLSPQPANSHQYLARLDLPILLQAPYRPRRGARDRGPTNPLRKVAA